MCLTRELTFIRKLKSASSPQQVPQRQPENKTQSSKAPHPQEKVCECFRYCVVKGSKAAPTRATSGVSDSISGADARQLSYFMRLELLEDMSGEEISKLWQEYHRDKVEIMAITAAKSVQDNLIGILPHANYTHLADRMTVRAAVSLKAD